jgi:hypothetical protein
MEMEEQERISGWQALYAKLMSAAGTHGSFRFFYFSFSTYLL